ncbi:hypothetical protein S7335_944 [Synechococcus sp. PCC 7335]|nr:hypothetical protein S7335_944 [Synechococcus sp. PCC 7335]
MEVAITCSNHGLPEQLENTNEYGELLSLDVGIGCGDLWRILRG